MKETNAADSSPKLWGIYHQDREYARELGDRLRTVIQTITKEEAEREAVRLGFDSPWAHPVTETEAKKAEWLPLQRARTTSTRQRI